MTNTTEIYETGASSHAVNDLILFTDNTRELVELRDKIYRIGAERGGDYVFIQEFTALLTSAIGTYIKEFPEPESHNHIFKMDEYQRNEFCRLYASDFDTWKKEHGF